MSRLKRKYNSYPFPNSFLKRFHMPIKKYSSTTLTQRNLLFGFRIFVKVGQICFDLKKNTRKLTHLFYFFREVYSIRLSTRPSIAIRFGLQKSLERDRIFFPNFGLFHALPHLAAALYGLLDRFKSTVRYLVNWPVIYSSHKIQDPSLEITNNYYDRFD
jgi:hypothetical protein